MGIYAPAELRVELTALGGCRVTRRPQTPEWGPVQLYLGDLWFCMWPWIPAFLATHSTTYLVKLLLCTANRQIVWVGIRCQERLWDVTVWFRERWGWCQQTSYYWHYVVHMHTTSYVSSGFSHWWENCNVDSVLGEMWLLFLEDSVIWGSWWLATSFIGRLWYQYFSL